MGAELENVFLISTDVMAFQTVLIKVTKRIALVHERTTASNAIMEIAFSTSLNVMMKMIVMTEVMKRIVHQENRKQSRKESTTILYQNGNRHGRLFSCLFL